MPSSEELIRLRVTVPPEYLGQRLDRVAARLFPEYSRSRLQQWIKDGSLRVDGGVGRPKDKLAGGEVIEVAAQPMPEGDWEAQAIPLDILYEDEALLVVDKPAGLVVHPAAGNPDNTLLNALLHHCPQLETIPRAGIVHRLDKDTTGLMVVAKSLVAHSNLVAQLQARSVTRQYEAVVQGVLTGGGTVDAPIGRHPTVRTKMAVVPRGGKPAVTHYRVLQRFDCHTHIRVNLETGRTHQIRVHMAHLGYPLVGDSVYGGRLRLPSGAGEALRDGLRGFKRQALHAAALALAHPVAGTAMAWESPLPDDMVQLLRLLSTDSAAPDGEAQGRIGD